jgi:hypothetical protein
MDFELSVVISEQACRKIFGQHTHLVLFNVNDFVQIGATVPKQRGRATSRQSCRGILILDSDSNVGLFSILFARTTPSIRLLLMVLHVRSPQAGALSQYQKFLNLFIRDQYHPPLFPLLRRRILRPVLTRLSFDASHWKFGTCLELFN